MVIKPTESESYRQEHKFYDKQFPEQNPQPPTTTPVPVIPDQIEFNLEPPATATVRLYRFGPTPMEAAQSDMENLRTWARDSLESSGAASAVGRWFTSDRADAESFSQDHAGYQLRHVDVVAEDAARWMAKDHPNAQRFAREPATDYFIPSIVANQAERTERSPRIEKPLEQSMVRSR